MRMPDEFNDLPEDMQRREEVVRADARVGLYKRIAWLYFADLEAAGEGPEPWMARAWKHWKWSTDTERRREAALAKLSEEDKAILGLE